MDAYLRSYHGSAAGAYSGTSMEYRCMGRLPAVKARGIKLF